MIHHSYLLCTSKFSKINSFTTIRGDHFTTTYTTWEDLQRVGRETQYPNKHGETIHSRDGRV